MITKNKGKEKLCCFYVSEFHLEMILLPYINKKIEENEEITILTEINLRNSLEILISKMNLKEEAKKRILELEWNKEEKIKENSNIIIIGSEKFIKEKNETIKNAETIVDCYNFDEVKENMNNIISEYKNSLNTLGKINF